MVIAPGEALSATEIRLLELDRVPEPPTDQIEYRIADSRNEREAAFRLVYRAYTQIGLIEPNPYQMRVTPYHLLDTTETFIAVYRGEVLSTVSLIGDGRLQVPMESVFADQIGDLRRRSFVFGEVSCLADRRRELSRALPVVVQMFRLLGQYARHQGMDGLVIACHPKHSRFYRRFIGFEPISSEFAYPNARNRPAIACLLDFHVMDANPPPMYSQLFGSAIPVSELERRPMDPEQVAFFGPAAQVAGCCVTVASD